MKKEEYKELMQLSIYGELSNEDQVKLDAYLKKHPDLNKEYQKLKKLRSFISQNTSSKTSDDLLNDARGQLREALRKERNKKSFINQIIGVAAEFLQPQIALGGVTILLFGMMIGYYSFSSKTVEQSLIFQPVVNSADAKPQTSISNVRFIDCDASDGEIEFEFDAVAPMHIKGKIDDPEIQKVLTHALLNESNAGVRLSSVSAFRNQSENKKIVDPAIKTTLIKSLTTDENPGVRSEALRVLQRCDFGTDIRDALLHVIAKDENSGIRVAAINALEIIKMDGTKFDDVTINALKQQIGKEQNNYIRNRAVNLVKEIYQ
ncbi:MAG: HEAT repeat domain-containing protein [Bacteroidota bacterium]|nr:HEAT repeat domain-containing protein [Bacteroidota bacterium]